jgi:hypothetical protein
VRTINIKGYVRLGLLLWNKLFVMISCWIIFLFYYFTFR